MTNAIKVLLQRQSGFLQLVLTFATDKNSPIKITEDRSNVWDLIEFVAIFQFHVVQSVYKRGSII
jgi:hypothetical protein